MSVKLKNRKEIEQVLKKYLEQLVVPESLIVGICQHQVSKKMEIARWKSEIERLRCPKVFVSQFRSMRRIWSISRAWTTRSSSLEIRTPF